MQIWSFENAELSQDGEFREEIFEESEEIKEEEQEQESQEETDSYKFDDYPVIKVENFDNKTKKSDILQSPIRKTQ